MTVLAAGLQDVSDPRDVVGVRSMLGVCPQSNIMSPQLTCADHLQLFACLKGVESSEVKAAVRALGLLLSVKSSLFICPIAIAYSM